MKKSLIFIFAISFILLNGFFISGICCERLKNQGMWCQGATNINECDNDYFIWNDKETCEGIPECEGTCVNDNSGECSERVAKAQCEESNGKWDERLPSEIPSCQEVCCLIGQDAYFINPTECEEMFTRYNTQGIIRTDITSRSSCEAMQSNLKIGACVISTIAEKTCIISTNLDCVSDKISELSQNLQNPHEENQIDIEFHDGLLCTASGISDCAKSENTECRGNKVYYKDTCGNFANIYDSNKYESVDYWTYLKDEYNPNEVCVVGEGGSANCGNCEPSFNSVCQEYNDAEINGNNAPRPQHNSGGFVCGGLTCQYKGRIYEHGESWCEGTSGTLIIHQNLTTGEIFESNLTALANQSRYNLPGSRYYKLVCYFGEVLVEECGDYRNQICIQGVDDYSGFHTSSCIFNTWRTCFELTSRTDCESSEGNQLCKWVPGYRWDFEIVSEAERKEQQGSCVPLVAPGFDFWKGTSQGNKICTMATIQDSALFETSWRNKRSNFAEWSDKTHSHQCINGCYTIPGYGKEFNQKPGEEKQYPEEINSPNSNYQRLTEYYDESEFKLPNSISSVHLSERQGQYCHKDGKEDQWLTGGIKNGNCRDGTCYDCTPGAGSEDKDEEKERDYPIYLTHQEWINGITERLRSLGDCGYKRNIDGDYSDPNSEIVTAIFQTLSQKGSVKKNITAEQIIYRGGVPVQGELYTIESDYEVKQYSCSSDFNGICTSTVNNPEPCAGGTQSSEGTCPEKTVCCIIEILE